MKRLIVITALSVFAVASYAASFSWGNSVELTDPSSATMSTGSVFLLSASTNTASIFNGSAFNSAEVSQVYATSTFLAPGYVWDTQTLPSGFTPAPYYAMLVTTANVSNVTDLGAGDSYVLFTWTPAIGDPMPEGDRSYEAMFTGAELPEGYNWQTIVPEPTALALLALGVAGLALRRKVA